MTLYHRKPDMLVHPPKQTGKDFRRFLVGFKILTSRTKKIFVFWKPNHKNVRILTTYQAEQLFLYYNYLNFKDLYITGIVIVVIRVTHNLKFLKRRQKKDE